MDAWNAGSAISKPMVGFVSNTQTANLFPLRYIFVRLSSQTSEREYGTSIPPTDLFVPCSVKPACHTPKSFTSKKTITSGEGGGPSVGMSTSMVGGDTSAPQAWLSAANDGPPINAPIFMRSTPEQSMSELFIAPTSWYTIVLDSSTN